MLYNKHDTRAGVAELVLGDVHVRADDYFFYFILFYFILFYSILFHFILIWLKEFWVSPVQILSTDKQTDIYTRVFNFI